MRLLDESNPLVTVLHGDGSEWTALGGEEFDAEACGREHEVLGDLCDSDDTPGDMDVSLGVYRANPFVRIARQKFGTRCAPGDVLGRMEASLRASAEHEIGEALWEGVSGTWGGTVYMTSGEISRTTLTGDAKADVAAILKEAREKHPDIDPLLHLGYETSLVLGKDLEVLDVPYVVNSGYPVDGLAVTGAITIRLGDVQVLRTIKQDNNRLFAEAIQLAAFHFDPCLARLGSTTS